MRRSGSTTSSSPSGGAPDTSRADERCLSSPACPLTYPTLNRRRCPLRLRRELEPFRGEHCRTRGSRRLGARSRRCSARSRSPDRTFLDIGSGSGLFSLSAAAARRRARPLARLRPGQRGDDRELEEALRGRARLDDRARQRPRRGHMRALGQWDIVYSWGVLHHTGDMWRAIENTCARRGARRAGCSSRSTTTRAERAACGRGQAHLQPAAAPLRPRLRVARDGADRAPRAAAATARSCAPELLPAVARGERPRPRHGPLARPRRLGRRLPVRGRQARGDLRFCARAGSSCAGSRPSAAATAATSTSSSSRRDADATMARAGRGRAASTCCPRRTTPAPRTRPAI